MRAIVLEGPAAIEERPLRIIERPDPRPGAGEVLLEVSACGACRTDLHTVEGDLVTPAYPVVPGHQIVGRVLALGEGVGQDSGAPAVGDRVGVAWLASACGACERCLEGRENLCDEARFTGLHVDGGYAELVCARASYVFAIPPALGEDASAAPLLCAGIIGYRALRLSGARAGDRLGMLGFGASAHLTIQVARRLGIEVCVFSRTEAHREHATELGASWVGDLGDELPGPLDAAISFAPVGSVVPGLLESMAPGATLALAGVTMSPIPELDYERHLYRERSIIGVANFTRDDAHNLLDYAAEIPIRTGIETFPLEDANEVLRRIKASEIRGAAVLVCR